MLIVPCQIRGIALCGVALSGWWGHGRSLVAAQVSGGLRIMLTLMALWIKISKVGR
jgi:hypothetical protein